MLSLSQLHLLTVFVRYVKDQGSYEKSDIVEGYVDDFIKERGMDIKFGDDRIEI